MKNHSLGIFEQFSRVSLLFGLSLVFLAKETFQLEGSTQCFNGSLPCLSCDGTSCAHCYYFENYLEDQKINGTTTRKVNCTARQNDVPNCLQQALLNGTKYCTICVHGYYFNSESKSCQKGSLKNCVLYERSPNKTGICMACGNYTLLQGTQDNQRCQELPANNIIPNCFIQGLKLKGVVNGEKVWHHFCDICDSGYSLDSSSSGCIKECSAGCFKCKDGSCLQCNQYLRYFGLKNGSCKQHPAPANNTYNNFEFAKPPLPSQPSKPTQPTQPTKTGVLNLDPNAEISNSFKVSTAIVVAILLNILF